MVERLIENALNTTRLVPGGGTDEEYIKGDKTRGNFAEAVAANTPAATVTLEYLVAKAIAPSLDITASLNAKIQQIRESGAKGGIIVVPNGEFTADGGFDVPAGTIEGVGKSVDTGYGTRITQNPGSTAQYMFGIGGSNLMGGSGKHVKGAQIKNLEINMVNKPAGHGILITNAPGFAVYGTRLENVLVHYGPSGGTGTALRVDAAAGVFECILMDVLGCDFKGGNAAFFCNTNNSGFTFKNIYSSQKPGGIALDANIIGTLHVNDWLAVGNSPPAAGGAFQSDGTIFLRTNGLYNNILIENCQNELIEFIYRNTTNPYPRKAITWKNNLIQGKMLFTAQGSLIDENNTWVNPVGSPNIIDGGTDATGAWVHLYRVGKGYVEMRNASGVPQANPVLTNFTNPYSRIYDHSGNINPFKVVATAAETQVVNASRGVVKVAAGATSVAVYNNLVDANSFINVFKTTQTNAVIAGVEPGAEFFTIFFSTAPTTAISLGFEVVKGVISEPFEGVR